MADLKATSPSKERAEYSDLLLKLLTALFYGVSSFMIMVVNKRVLTVYSFPSFQGYLKLYVKFHKMTRFFSAWTWPNACNNIYPSGWQISQGHLFS